MIKQFNQLKPLLVAVIAFLIGSITTVWAMNGSRTIQVEYRDITINVNDSETDPELEPFIYQERTFVPLRFVAESLDMKVYWEAETKTIDIYDPRDQKDEKEKDTNGDEEEEKTVYISFHGEEYHRKDCELFEDDHLTPVPLELALESGYIPCEVCDPPQ